jgi:Fe-S-cluster containining protein
MCRIYEMRPSICRVYPYMLHKEPDERGNVDWRQICGLDRHGEYHTPVSGEDALQSANETKRFEEAVLDREISYLECTGEYFLEHGLRHVRKKYDEGLRLARKGADIEVMVFFQEAFERCVIKAGTPLQMTLTGVTKSGKKV